MKSLLAWKSSVQIGDRFERLEVVGLTFNVRSDQGIRQKWCVCRCNCGKYIATPISALNLGRTKSCGCWNRDKFTNKTHGLTKHPLYQVWCSIVGRCTNEKNSAYVNYGGRGISICDEWRNDAEAFVKWAVLHGWQRGLEIDRINNEGNYEPDNCRFVTKNINSRNRRSTHMLTLGGRAQCVTAWAEEIGARPGLIYARLRMGWSVEKALTTPCKK
jgi:hypothetical protein